MQRSHRRLRLHLAVVVSSMVVAVATTVPLGAQPSCPCTTQRPFGSCVIRTLNNYPSEAPGSVEFAVREIQLPDDQGVEIEQWFLVPDIYTGFTYRFNPAQPTQAPQALFSPRGSRTTSGIAYHAGADALFWAIDGMLVVTGFPDPSEDSFPDVLVEDEDGIPRIPLEYEVDLEDLAERLFGSADRAGTLGGIAYHGGRNRLWAVDIVNDVYFEVVLDDEERIARPALDASNEPIHFRSPALSEFGGGAYGNTLTFAATDAGMFFDLPVGSLLGERPTTVVRVHAPADPEAFGLPIGADTGVRYPLVPELAPPTQADVLFPTGIAYWKDSCGAGQGSEFVVLLDLTGSTHRIVEVSADPPTAGNVADLSGKALEPAIELTWRPTSGYTDLEIFRRRLPQDLATGEDSVFVYSADDGPDPGRFVDSTLVLPVDGTYEYRVEASRSTPLGDDPAFDVSCVVTIGRGSVEGTSAFTGSSDNFPANPSGPRPIPHAVTSTADHLYVVDVNTGVAQRYLLPAFSAVDNVEGPFVGEGKTVGIAYNTTQSRLYWVGTIRSTEHFLQSTALDGSDRGPRVRVQFPATILRNPVFGDIGYDAQRNAFWIVDTLSGLIFAVAPDGSLVADSTIEDPFPDGFHSGGLAVAEADGSTVLLDIIGGPESAGRVDRLIRNRYEISSLTTPTTEYVLELSRTTGAAQPGSTAFVTLDDGETEESLHIVAGGDTALVYLLRASEASFGDKLPFRRGDANNDGEFSISDPSFILSWLFKGGARPACEDAADVDDSGELDITDAVVLFAYLFSGGPDPEQPFPTCGIDITTSSLGCEESVCADENPA